MISNYIRISWRNLMKHKGFSFINIFGLSIGLTCCLLISLYIYHEISYDSYHENGGRLYQLGAVSIDDGNEVHRSTVPAAVTDALKQEIPEIEERARLLYTFLDDKTLLQYREPGQAVKSFYENKGYLADPTIFKLLTYDFIEGNPSTALENPNAVVITEDIAKKLFGAEQALNKTIMIRSSTNGDNEFLITGVFRPKNSPSHIDARFFMSARGGAMERFFLNGTTMVNNNMFYSYLLLQKGVDPKSVESKFPDFVDRHMGQELRARGIERRLFLTHIEDIHLHPKIESNVTPPGSRVYLHILASIAILTLLIACINFMNLSTSRSTKRGLEVGVRKVLGAERNALIRQFLGESLIMALLAFGFALVFTSLLMPVFEKVAGKELHFSFHQYGYLIPAFLVLSIITGLFAGSYPAFYLSSFKPVRVLKGRFSNSFAVASLRKGMVIFQFVVSVALIIGSVVISNQMSYLRSKDLGFIKDQQLVIPLRSTIAKNNYSTLKNSINALPNVREVGASNYYPGIFNPMDWLMFKEGKTLQEGDHVYINFIDETFLQALGIRPVSGRLFSPNFPADTSNNIIINEKTISQLGFSSAEDAVGQWIAIDDNGSPYKFNIVGVVNDFHFKDLHTAIEPYGFLLSSDKNFNYIIAHLSENNLGGTIQSIEQAWSASNPDEPFEYSFLDQDFQKNYEAENRLTSMIGYFTIIAIVISCLGLFGLASFSFEQRIKEIGIRKVMGASVSNLVSLLSMDFLKLIFVAIIFAIPIAWYVMNEWLSNFAYKITISWQIFFLTSCLTILIALITISFQAIKAAMADPVKNLRAE